MTLIVHSGRLAAVVGAWHSPCLSNGVRPVVDEAHPQMWSLCRVVTPGDHGDSNPNFAGCAANGKLTIRWRFGLRICPGEAPVEMTARGRTGLGRAPFRRRDPLT